MGTGLKQWLLVALGICLIVLGFRGRFGSGIAALLVPDNMAEVGTVGSGAEKK